MILNFKTKAGATKYFSKNFTAQIKTWFIFYLNIYNNKYFIQIF